MKVKLMITSKDSLACLVGEVAMPRRQQLLKNITKGERAVAEGNTYTQQQAKSKMLQWLC